VFSILPVASTPLSDVPPIAMSRDSVFVGVKCTASAEILSWSTIPRSPHLEFAALGVGSLMKGGSCKREYGSPPGCKVKAGGKRVLLWYVMMPQLLPGNDAS
jgi:hypothetical protein